VNEYRRGCRARRCAYAPSIKLQIDTATYYSPRITLVNEQIGILKKRLPKFKSADLAGKRDIVNEIAETLKKRWRQKYGDFIRKPVENVCASLGTPNEYHTVLEHSTISLQHLQKAVEEIRF
jgi:hypothetical protein